VVVTGVILVAQDHLLAEVRLLGFVGMLPLLVASLSADWLLGGPGSDSRKTLALTASLCNVGVNVGVVDRAVGKELLKMYPRFAVGYAGRARVHDKFGNRNQAEADRRTAMRLQKAETGR
jgi:hypothetical protein